MALYDAFEALDYGSGAMTLEAAKQAVDDSLAPVVLSKTNGEIIHVSFSQLHFPVACLPGDATSFHTPGS